MRIWHCAALILAASLSWPASGNSQNNKTRASRMGYAIRDISDFGYGSASAINNAGWIIGGGNILWQKGKVTRLPGLTSAIDLNNAGQIVGDSISGFAHGLVYDNAHALLWQQGSIQDIGDRKYGAQCYVSAINNKGQVAVNFNDHPLVWQNGRLTRLPTLPNNDPRKILKLHHVSDINDNGDAVGFAWWLQEPRYEDVGHAMLWHNGKISDIGTLPHTNWSEAKAINNKGQIIGFSQLFVSGQPNTGRPFVRQAFLWQNGRMKALGMLTSGGSSAAAINNKGQIVGASACRTPGRPSVKEHAFLWQKGRMYDLNDCIDSKSDWILEEATGINDHGQIIGTGRHHGKLTAFLMTPRRSGRSMP